eukprot:1030420-Prorocentrum_minimum.AAC.1
MCYEGASRTGAREMRPGLTRGGTISLRGDLLMWRIADMAASMGARLLYGGTSRLCGETIC